MLISWDPNPESDLGGYHLYKRTLPSQDFGQPVFSGLPGNPSAPSTIVTGLSDGTTYEFMLTAFDTSGNESAPSQGIQITLPEATPPPQPQPLPRSSWQVWADSEEISAENGRGTNVKDGNGSTAWVTQWSPTSTPPPHDLLVDLTGVATIGGFKALPRTTSNGRTGAFYVATNQSATPPPLPPQAPLIPNPADWQPVKTGTWPNTATEKTELFGAVTGRYVLLRAQTEAQGVGNPWTALAEFYVLGTLQ